MMDNATGNKSHIPCPLWTGQISWSAAPTQGALLNSLSTSQQLSLGSPSDQRPQYDQLQPPGLNCLSDLSALSRNNTNHTNLFKSPQMSISSSSASLFANTAATPSTSNIISFVQLSSHTSSSTAQTANQGKTIPPPPLQQTNQGSQPQHLPLTSHDSYKASFQPPLPSQSLPNGPQDLPISLPSCSQHATQEPQNKSQPAFEGMSAESTGVAGFTHSRTSSVSQEQHQWIPSSHCSGAGDKSVSDAAAQPDKEPSQKRSTTAPTRNETLRSVLLQQRTLLLNKLADLDKLLKTLPPDDNSDGQTSQSGVQSHLSDDCSSPESFSDPIEFAEEAEDAMAVSEEESDPDFFPSSDGNFSDFMSVSEKGSSDESSPTTPSVCPRRTLSRKRKAKSGSPVLKDEDTTPTKKRRTMNQRRCSALVLPCISSKKQKRVYDKKNYCVFCSKPVIKMARHLETVHSDQAEVAAAFQYPKNSKERLKIWNRLKNKGNFAHNKDVLRTGKGYLAVRKRPRKAGQGHEFVHCLYCQGLYWSKALYRHMKKCPERDKNENEPKIGRNRLTLRCVLETLDLDISGGLKGILSSMTYDAVTQAVINHKIILQFGETMFDQHGADIKRHNYIRQNLRQIARLVLEAQKLTPLKELEDFFLPSNFKHVVSAVNVLAGYNSKNKTYSSPSLAIKLGYQLQKLCGIVESNAESCGNASLAESARSFLTVYKNKWNNLVSSGALTTLKETKLVTEKKVPFAQDVMRLNSHMANVHVVAEKKVRDRPCAETYALLAKVILARTILFNRRKPGEVSRIQLIDFMSRKLSNTHSYMSSSLSDLERTMCGFFTRVEIRGNCGRLVPVLLKPSFVSGLELLVKIRGTCGVPSENFFLFGRPNALSAYNGAECIQIYVKECGAKHPETLTTAKIRKHFASMLQMMNLDEDEANQILGPNNYQVLQQSTRVEDVMTSDGTFHPDGTQPGASWNHNQFSGECHQPAGLYQNQMHQAPTTANGTEHQKPASFDKPRKAPQSNGKQKWEEAEVRAVERHMMRFIQGHKVPQKFDCIQCLEAEPEALRTRSWKGVKDYVRNRITALKRQSGSTRTLSTNSDWPVQEESSGYFQQL
ncbi:uncharacterized protein LOC115426292 isoform X2 [Sphaeramia orbicularis]|uniref:uncharacterized protein LOC115426292 isoform X2 n=1 Tax=Sphaeramia orbicularis TaxID=375764 RepID=UPI00117DCECB|nr:uncharacterized protein LOC115426292 isoform X2 [Sphaeramia orbicularis]